MFGMLKFCTASTGLLNRRGILQGTSYFNMVGKLNYPKLWQNVNSVNSVQPTVFLCNDSWNIWKTSDLPSLFIADKALDIVEDIYLIHNKDFKLSKFSLVLHWYFNTWNCNKCLLKGVICTSLLFFPWNCVSSTLQWSLTKLRNAVLQPNKLSLWWVWSWLIISS